MRVFTMGSLWNMLRIDTDQIFPPISHLVGSLSEWRIFMQIPDLPHWVIPIDKAVGYLKSLQLLRDISRDIGLHATHHILVDEYDDVEAIVSARTPLDNYKMQRLTAFSEKVYSVFVAEMKSKFVMCLPGAHAQFLMPLTPLFGELVEDAFPAAALEIADAGRCRAAGLWTASVMHLMRALEDAMGALARYVDVEPASNWNNTLNLIDQKLKERNKRNFGDEEEQWASEASAHLRNIKNAWRNHVQHGRIRYNEVEAVAIWSNVQSLFQTLAKRLTE